jgi:release factor glutamine methyltransferase
LAEDWTVIRVLQWTAEHLRQKGVDNGRLDAELLLAETLGLDRVGLYLNYDKPLQVEELSRYREQVKRRASREPLQYILGSCEFWSLSLQVTPAVLIPRPDTEVLVEEALKHISKSGSLLDVGTGSGAIALALASELPESTIVGLDRSAAALQIARQNRDALGLQERVELLEGDLFDLPEGKWQLIVSNPPYIPSGELAGLMPEVGQHEPATALDGGADGLDCYRALCRQAQSKLQPGGWLLVEVGIDQAEAVKQLFVATGLTEVYSREDYAGVPRVVGGRN